MLKKGLKRIAADLTWRMLRVAGMPRYIETFESGLWQQGSACLRHRYGTPPTPDHPRYINFFEARAFSQHGEDGILCHLFSELGTTDRRFVEFGVESGRECNCASLAINFGWSGLLMDGDEGNARSGRAFYRAMIPDRPEAVTFNARWITRENINDLLKDAGYTGEIDLLSIDIDGNDYWVWEAIEVVTPRVVVIEYNALFGPSRAVTLPYDPAFNRFTRHPRGLIYGASLAALAKLGRRKGYGLVGCESRGVNAFFVRDDVLREPFRAWDAETAYIPRHLPERELQSVAGALESVDWVEV